MFLQKRLEVIHSKGAGGMRALPQRRDQLFGELTRWLKARARHIYGTLYRVTL